MATKRYSHDVSNRTTGRHKRSFVFTGADNVKGRSVIDVGCSYGWFAKWVVENGCISITAMEPYEKHLDNVRREVPSARCIVGSSLEIPSANNSFDVAVMWEVLEHLPKGKEKNALLEIKRVLKNGGEFYLSTPHRSFWSCVLDPAWWLAGHRHYSCKQIKALAGKVGFSVEKVEYGGGFWELHSMILLYIFKWFFRREIPFKDWFEKKRDVEFLYGNGWTNIFIKLKKV